MEDVALIRFDPCSAISRRIIGSMLGLASDTRDVASNKGCSARRIFFNNVPSKSLQCSPAASIADGVKPTEIGTRVFALTR
jgi:hypothetical protein